MKENTYFQASIKFIFLIHFTVTDQVKLHRELMGVLKAYPLGMQRKALSVFLKNCGCVLKKLKINDEQEVDKLEYL